MAVLAMLIHIAMSNSKHRPEVSDENVCKLNFDTPKLNTSNEYQIKTKNKFAKWRTNVNSMMQTINSMTVTQNPSFQIKSKKEFVKESPSQKLKNYEVHSTSKYSLKFTPNNVSVSF